MTSRANKPEPLRPQMNREELLEALIEVETILTPTFVQEHVPPVETIAFLADGIYARLTGESEIDSDELRAMLIQFVLLAWSQKLFTPGPCFPYSYEQVLEAFQASPEDSPDSGLDQSPPSLPETSEEMSPYERLKYEMRDIDLARDTLIARGIQALDRKHYTRAEQYLREAVQADMLDESEACYFLALTRLWQRDFDEASYLFEVDSQDREGEAPLSWLFSLWCALCASSSLAEYFITLRYALEEEGDPLADLQEHFEFDYAEYDDEGLHACATALFAYLQDAADVCLLSLEDFEPDLLSIPAWFVSFWRVMAMVELGKEDAAQITLQQMLAEDIPPLLLLPLRWSEHDHPHFFESTVSPLFTTYDLWTQVTARNEREHVIHQERQQQAQWWMTHLEEKLPGFSKIEQALTALRDRPQSGDSIFHALTHPDSEKCVQAYLEQSQYQRIALMRNQPVFLAEIPPPRSSRSPAYLVTALLEQLGDPSARKRDGEIQKRLRLIQLLQSRKVQLVILTHIDRLTTPSGTKLLQGEIEWLRHLFANEIKSIPLVLVGPAAFLKQIQTTNTQLHLSPLVSGF